MNVKQTIGWIAAGMLALSALPAAAQDHPLHGRVSYDAGGGLIKGAEDSDYSNAGVNTLVLPGDTIWADDGSTTELEFSGGTFLRLADGSKMEAVSLPPGGVFRGWVGSFYVQRLKRSSGDVVFETPAARLDIDADTNVRVDILSNGAATVSVRWGSVRLFTDVGDALQIRSGQRVWVDPGLLPSEPASFNRAEEDAFDAWARERAEFLATGAQKTPQSVSYSSSTIGYSDLDRYGEWVYVDNRHYWRPTVVVDYVPYRYGYWSHSHRIGNVWVGNYPFSYTTSHYGRWRHHHHHGWIWSYDPVWSPAWVTTVRYGDYLLWSPVDYYHRPVLYGGYHSSHFTIGGVRFGFYASSCVPYSSFYGGHGPFGYAYASPFHHDYYHHHGQTNININIWNINAGGRRNHVQTPFDNVFTERNYNPQRSIRGPLMSGARSTVLASDRVRGLESRAGRTSFTSVDRTGVRGTRTAATPEQRSAQTRVARVSQSAPEIARATRANPVNARESFARTTGVRPETARTLTNDDAARAGRSNPVSRSVSSTPRTTTRGSTVSVEPPSRSTTPRTITTRTDTDRDTSSSRRVVSTSPRTSSRTTVPSSRSVQTAPSTRSTSPRVTTAPRTSTTSRTTVTPRSSTTTPRQITTTPRSTTSSPRISTTNSGRSTVSRQAMPSTRSSAPSRVSTSQPSTSRNIAPPSRSISTPAPSRSVAPSRSIAPSGRSSVSTRSAAPTRSFTSPPSNRSGISSRSSSSPRSIGSSSSSGRSSISGSTSSGRGSVNSSIGARGSRSGR